MCFDFEYTENFDFWKRGDPTNFYPIICLNIKKQFKLLARDFVGWF